jgi:hypothetical protein
MPLSGMSKAWVELSAAMPLGWHLDSLRCASTGLQPDQRSNRWVAIAIGPNGHELAGEGDGEILALNALARELAKIRGSMSG